MKIKCEKAARDGDRAAFKKLVAPDAVMVCGSYRTTGAQYAEFISDFGIFDFEISGFETVLETDETVQVHYVAKTTANAPENEDLAGAFHVTSTGEKRDGEWVIVFNIDSRILE